jgi:hypothetical protein
VYEDTIRALREGKTRLRQMRQRASIEEKLLDLWRGQHAYVQIVKGRRPLYPWEQPWNIRSDVRDAIIIKDGAVESFDPPISGSSSRWVQRSPRVILSSWALDGMESE